MKRKLCSLLIVLCLVACVVPMTALALTDTESNNTLGTAQKVDLGDTIDGNISVLGDLDFYEFTLTESGRIELDMTSYMQWYCLYLLDADGTTLMYSECNTWNSTVGFLNDVYTIDLTAGTYCIKVSGAYNEYGEGDPSLNSTGKYTLVSSFTSANVTETEANNSIADANSMGLSETVRGQIAVNDGYDFYKITLTESGRLGLDVTSYMQYHSLYLYDSRGTNLWYADDNVWNSTVGFLNDVYTIDLTAGTYYLKVIGAYNEYCEGDPSASSTGNYTLVSSFTAASVTETESNNSIADANEVGLTGTVTGQIAVNDGYDFYKITLLEDRRIEFDVTSYMQYYSLYIYDANGDEKSSIEWKEWNADVGFREDSWYVDLTAGTYYFKITGYNYDGGYATTGTYKIEFNHVDVPEVAISNVSSTGKIKLTWGTVDGAAKYKVYRSTSKNGTYSLLNTTTKTSLTNSTAVAGKTYYYYVVAVNEYGDTSEPSDIVNRTCDLARPTVTLSNVASSGKIKVSWEKVDGAVKYEVYRATSKNGTYTKLITTTKTAITNTSATAGKTYYYKVKAIASKSAANSAYSSVKSRVCDLARPDVTVELNTKGKPVVDWDKISGATKYKVYIYSSSGKLLKTVTTTGTKLTHSSAVKGTTYNYRVVAVASNSSANSAKSVKDTIKSK